ncbi:MAG: 30S ribosome-binding factor RbfA [Brevinematales bacterium]
MATSRRIEKVNKTLMKEISEVIFREIKDPRLTSMISVVECSMSSDMRNLKVKVSIFGGSEIEQLKSLNALNHASGFISSIVSKSLRLRYAPNITFEKTDSISNGVDMYFKIKELTKDEVSDSEE